MSDMWRLPSMILLLLLSMGCCLVEGYDNHGGSNGYNHGNSGGYYQHGSGSGSGNNHGSYGNHGYGYNGGSGYNNGYNKGGSDHHGRRLQEIVSDTNTNNAINLDKLVALLFKAGVLHSTTVSLPESTLAGKPPQEIDAPRDGFEFAIPVPGFTPGDKISVTVLDNVLTVSGQKLSDTQAEAYIRVKTDVQPAFMTGFSCSYQLPHTDAGTARLTPRHQLEHGVLTVVLRKT